ncbi:hypothetical protein TYRP_023318 [Tyrophagus putrescentiae]|nr:hypothetical protein TYRP_023318 [Tyrophagus putrescentiae]
MVPFLNPNKEKVNYPKQGSSEQKPPELGRRINPVTFLNHNRAKANQTNLKMQRPDLQYQVILPKKP